MANRNIFISCKECGEKFRIAKSDNMGFFVPFCENFAEQLNDFYEQHAFCNDSKSDSNFEITEKKGGGIMGNTSLGVRMITYRARHRLSQRAFAELIGENLATVFRIENSIHKPHKINEIRLTEKMDKLEAEEKRCYTDD